MPPPQPPIRPETGFDALLGLSADLEGLDDGFVRGTLKVSDDLKQPAGVVHGGVYASVAETLASAATWLVVSREGQTAMGLSNSTSFLRPVTEGTIHAEAHVRHRGRTTWIWDVECSDDEGRLCAVTRMTIAVREPRT